MKNSPAANPFQELSPLARLQALLKIGLVQRERLAKGGEGRKFSPTKSYADGRQKQSKSHLSKRRRFAAPQSSRLAKARAKQKAWR